MTRRTFDVAPIDKGGDSIVSIDYGPNVASRFNWQTGRMLVHFKNILTDATPAAVIDSAITPLAVVRTGMGVGHRLAGGFHLDLKLTAAQTAMFTRDSVTFDILVFDAGSKAWLPYVWTWPVATHITVGT